MDEGSSQSPEAISDQPTASRTADYTDYTDSALGISKSAAAVQAAVFSSLTHLAAETRIAPRLSAAEVQALVPEPVGGAALVIGALAALRIKRR